MVEYLHDAIRATAGRDINIIARVLDEFGNEVSDNVLLAIYDKDSKEKLMEIAATDGGDSLIFAIAAETTKELKGRYWYSIKHNNEDLCFLQPIYFV